MKKFVKQPINASKEVLMNRRMMTPSNVTALLSQIKELEGVDVSLDTVTHEKVVFTVGDMVYECTL